MRGPRPNPASSTPQCPGCITRPKASCCNAGVVSLPLVSETFVQPNSIDFGVACVGALGDGTTDLLLDGLTETSMTWNGSKLELVFNFNTIQILNRFRIDLTG